jgi:4-diphosphocytidyl-2-C-methyl-D-erythritol kinase
MPSMADRDELRAYTSAYAKINLDLRVVAREDTGFHQIETIFQRITLSDRVSVIVRNGAGVSLVCSRDVGVPEEQNLAWRAAAVYRHAAAWPSVDHAIAIDIEKEIPTGAGLGGGSADAGAVLRALNALNPKPITARELLTVAATLGADVPFLASDAVTALAWGRGERMLSLPAPPQRFVRLAQFREGVNTADAYRALAAARAAGEIPPPASELHEVRRLTSWTELHRYARNDFERPVFAMRPDIATVHASMTAAAPGVLVRMSGSGASVFAVTNDYGDALRDAAFAWPKDWDVALTLAATLETLPPVQILSGTSGPR